MRLVKVALVTVAMASAACSQLSDAVSGRDQQTQHVIEDMQRRNREDEEKQARERHERERRRLDAANAQKALDAAAREAQQKTFVDRCESSRKDRVAQAKQEILDLAEYWSQHEARAKYFDQHCHVYDSRGVKVSRERISDGVIVRTQAVGDEFDVKCDGAPGRPKGIDAAWYREIMGWIEEGDRSIGDGLSGDCAKLDHEALGTNLNVSRSDREGKARIMALPK